jgi:hypothetical protein
MYIILCRLVLVALRLLGSPVADCNRCVSYSDLVELPCDSEKLESTKTIQQCRT